MGGVGGGCKWELVGTGQLSPASDTQSASHSLARPIVVWNLRNAFDRLAMPAWVLFWRSPEDKTVTREEKEKRQMRWWWRGGSTGYLDSFRARTEKSSSGEQLIEEEQKQNGGGGVRGGGIFSGCVLSVSRFA